jgi:hypothetical protein
VPPSKTGAVNATVAVVSPVAVATPIVGAFGAAPVVKFIEPELVQVYILYPLATVIVGEPVVLVAAA